MGLLENERLSIQPLQEWQGGFVAYAMKRGFPLASGKRGSGSVRESREAVRSQTRAVEPLGFACMAREVNEHTSKGVNYAADNDRAELCSDGTG
jgi:hypothetical protein